MEPDEHIGLVVIGHPVMRQPCIINAVVMLRRAGYKIDLFTIHDGKLPEHDFKDARVATHPYQRRSGSALERPIRQAAFLPWLLHTCRGKRYRCFIGVDPAGLIAATALGILLRVPVIYYSLELLLSSDHHGARTRVVKALERFCNRRSAWTIIQDENRAACLVEDNRIDCDRVLIVPNSPLGPAQISQRGYWHQKLGLPPEHKIVLQAGAIADWGLSCELAQAAAGWPDDWVLVLHGYVDGSPEYLDRIRQLAQNGHVRLSLEMVPYEQLDNLIASADVGVALYRCVDQNFYHMASGKVTHYLRCGVPVVAQDLPNLRSLLRDGRCGVCVNDAGEVREAVAKVLKDRSRYGTNATRCYEERLEFGHHFLPVLERIAAL